MRNPMKYDIIPTINGVYLSLLFEISESVPSLLAQNSIIAIGRSEAKISEITSKTMNLLKSNPLLLNDSTEQMIKNSGIVIIGGFVIVDIVFAILNLFINIFLN